MALPAKVDTPAAAGSAATARDERLRWLEAEVLRLQARLQQSTSAVAHATQQLACARQGADHDALTGLPNRRAFESLSRGLAADLGDPAASLAVLFIDLDGFKAVNDRHGHHTGDAVLRIVGARLAHAVRRGDFVCRLGGDEFVCVLPAVRGPAEARAIAAQLEKVLAAPCQLPFGTIELCASIGVAVHVGVGRDVVDLARRADAAMYAAKAIRRAPAEDATATSAAGAAART